MSKYTIDEIKEIDKYDMPEVAKNALAFSIVQFCKYNRITYNDRNELLRFGIQKHLLLPKPKSKN